jgi:hypothetical protein
MVEELLEVGDFFEFHAFFCKNHGAYMKEYDWRMGQVFFNLLGDRNAVCADKLRDHMLDPFHRDKVSDEVWNFISVKRIKHMIPQFISTYSISISKQVEKYLPHAPIIFFHVSPMILAKESMKLKEITNLQQLFNH